jgi:tetratricopeptide (TPR) repeat protein
VRYLVEGSVRRAGTELRIGAQLIDAHSDEHLWADKFGGSVDDVFGMQERIARAIVDTLALRLTPAEDRRLAERPIGSVPAYECYLQARQEVWRWRKDAIDRAIELLQRGIDIIGGNAVLYASLGFAWLQYREAGIDLSDRPLNEADAYARRVTALAPDSAASLQLRGWLDYSRGQIHGAAASLAEALAIDPNHADSLLLLINCRLISGQVAAARPLLDRLVAIDPLTPLTRCMPAFADVLEGKPEAALEPYRRMLEMDPLNPMSRLFYVWTLVLNRRTADLAAVVDGFTAETRDTIPARIARFLALALHGDAASATALITPDMVAASAATDVFPRFIAEGFSLLNARDEALVWLRRAVDRGFTNYAFLAEHDPLLRNLRADPRFTELLRAVSAMRPER